MSSESVAGSPADGAAVVIPAHNEERVLARLLGGLLDGPLPLEVVVVCNGCTDGTAAVARGFGDAVRVVETPVPSKVRALALGDAQVSGFPRLYVDADVELDNASVGRLCAALADGRRLAVGPRRVLPLDDASPLVRSYYRAWQQLPAVREGLWGRGVIALSAVGHERVGALPEVMSDDLAISLVFGPGERAVVDDALVVIRPPRTVASLLTRRRRSVTGNAALERAGTNRDGSRTRAGDLLALTRSSPRDLPGVLVLLTVAVAARVGAAWADSRGTSGSWGRDESSRVAPGLEHPPDRR